MRLRKIDSTINKLATLKSEKPNAFMIPDSRTRCRAANSIVFTTEKNTAKTTAPPIVPMNMGRFPIIETKLA